MTKDLLGDQPVADARRQADLVDLAESGDGFERQAAVEALHRLRRPEALPALLRRTNDWVRQVRQSAALALPSFLDDAFIGEWAAALPEVVALQRAQRADHQALLRQLAAFFSAPGNLARMVSATAGAGLQVRRYVFGLRWQAAAQGSERIALLEESLGGKDIDLARQALALLRSLPAAGIPEQVWAHACASCYAEVRLAALRLLSVGGAGRGAWLLELRFDASPAVAAVAWEAAKQEIPESAYRAALEGRVADGALSGQRRAGALAMLCRLDPAAAEACCLAAAVSPLAPLRRLALGFLVSRSDGARRDGLLLQALRDASPKVRRLAVEAAQRGVPLPAEDEVLAAALSHGSPSAVGQAMAVLNHASAWTRLHGALVALHALQEESAKAVCLQALGQWRRDMAKNFQSPTSAQKEAVRAAWLAARAGVPPPLAAHVESEMRQAGIVVAPD